MPTGKKYSTVDFTGRTQSSAHQHPQLAEPDGADDSACPYTSHLPRTAAPQRSGPPTLPLSSTAVASSRAANASTATALQPPLDDASSAWPVSSKTSTASRAVPSQRTLLAHLVSVAAQATSSPALSSEPSVEPSAYSTEFLGGKAVASMSINKHTAKDVLSELVKLPVSVSTYAARLECLKSDCSIPTWHALTHNPERLKALEQSDYSEFEENLKGRDVWLEEVESINSNVLMNLLVKLIAQYKASFQSLLLEAGVDEIKDISIIRGAPAVGKTSYLKGGFSIGTDEVRNYLQNRMPGVTMSQLYTHAYTLLDQFMSSMESKLSQALTRDALYLYPGLIENKLQAVGLQKGNQKAKVHDLQVDLKTLCCRILKRSTDEALMSFDVLSQYFRSSLENRKEALESVQKRHELISEYSLSVWDGSKYIKVAERTADSQDFIIHDKALFDQQVSRDPALIELEIANVRDTLIDRAFISNFTAGLEPAIAVVFADALSKYEGKTMAEALELHRDRDHVATSVASRVLADVVPS